MEFLLEDVKFEIDEIPVSRNYWFVRTYGGQIYEEFYAGDFIAMGLNNIPSDSIREAAKSKEQLAFIPLANTIHDLTEYKGGEATKMAKQLICFYGEVKENDIVIIPGENSDVFAIGKITSSVYLVESKKTFLYNGRVEKFPERRRKVKWMKTVSKEFFGGDLRNLISSHQAITKANNYYDIIEGSINSLFYKNNQMYLVLQVGTDEDINAFHLANFLNCLTFFYKEFCRDLGYPDNEELYIKIKLQSRGKAILRALAGTALAGVLLIFALSKDPEVEATYDKDGNFKIKGKSKSLGEAISDFLDRSETRRERKILFDDSIRSLNAAPATTDLNDSTEEVKEKRAK